MRTMGIAVGAALLVACGSDTTGIAAGGGGGLDAGVQPRDAGPGRDARVILPDAGGGLDAGSVLDGAAGGDAGPSPDGGTTPTEVRFVVLGDQGEGNPAQHEVGDAIGATCAALGCDFAVLLGDNFYNSGVSSVTDAQWEAKFEAPYRDLAMPFYAVLGNHDYGGSFLGRDTGGLGNEFEKGPIEVAYTDFSERWTMPDTHYTLLIGNVGFVMLDTNSILWGNTENGDQEAWFPGAVADLRADGAQWIIAAGHHPYRSNGRHGNAGSYESIEVAGVDVLNPLPILNGGNVRDFLEDIVCGEIDVYFAGHDHNRQWLDEPDALCGAELIVSGAGAKTTGLETEANEAHFADDTTEGFLYVRIRGDELYGRFVNRDGTTAFEQVVTRRSASP